MSNILQNTINETIIFSCEHIRLQDKIRLDAFLAEKAEISRAQASKAIENGFCLVNGEKAKKDYKVRKTDSISYVAEVINNELLAEEGTLDILYQDDDYVIINKPPNLTVHPATSQTEGTLVHILLSHFPQLREMEGDRPGIVHRIDKDTSGILVIALHDKARRALAELFECREVHKEYLALVHNITPLEGTIEHPIGRHESNKTKMAVKKNGRSAYSEYRVIKQNKDRNYSLLAVKIHTGRTHQIRVHLSYEGYPLMGDKVYFAKINKEIPTAFKGIAQRQMLHAWKIAFTQPLTHEQVEITCPLPKDMKDVLELLEHKTEKFIITGNLVAGKTTVLEYLKELGYPTFSADGYVRELYSQTGDGTFLLRRVFGEEIIPQDAGVDKEVLFKLLQNPENKEKVEKIIHPLVEKEMLAFFANCEERGLKKAFAEIPAYFESVNFNSEARNEYKVICVTVDPQARANRLKSRNIDAERASIIGSWQMPQDEKMQKCDILIENSGTLEELKEKCKLL